MAKKNNNPVKEITVFMIGIGVLLGVGAYFTLNGFRAAPDLWGFKRNVAIGVPLAVISFTFLFSGVSLQVTKAKWAVICSILSSFIATAFYFLFEISTIGFLRANLVSIIAYALPVLLIIRGKKAMSCIDEIDNSSKAIPCEVETACTL